MGGLFRSPKAPAPPPVTKPAILPDEAALSRAKKKSIVAQRRRTGRAATILSEKEALG